MAQTAGSKADDQSGHPAFCTRPYNHGRFCRGWIIMENYRSHNTSANEGLTWHKPQVQKLLINVETGTFAPGPGTIIDFANDG